MVQTRAATKRIESGQPEHQHPIVPSPKKKRLHDDAVKKRRRGKPGELCQLNLDVLFLLAAYVHPLDLLNLARTCKSLRELLMDKASTFVWKTARRQVEGLPDCPHDLTEPEYANLLFYARCHGCGKYAKKILWGIRKRYCPDCRKERLCPFSSCPDVIRRHCIIWTEFLAINGKKTNWVDKEQFDSLLREYDRASDKEQFLKDKLEEIHVIQTHARKCERWEEGVASERKLDLLERRRERYESIFERLQVHGYQPEIEYFGRHEIEQSRKYLFKRSKPVTEKEWALMLPEWLETMENFKAERIERVVHRPRRSLLISTYENYVMSRSENTPVYELLPHASDVAYFPPFREVIHAPEETDTDEKSFESALRQLPGLVDEWKKQLDNQFTELLEIPSNLSSDAVSDGVMSSNLTPQDLPEAPTDKLRLACAVFSGSYPVAHYPDLLCAMSMSSYPDGSQERTVSILQQFNIKFVKEAPYIIRTCGLDPNVATIEDADRRNARLKCLSCALSYVMSWRGAIRHAISYHMGHISLPESPRWQLVSDEYVDEIQTVEQSLISESNYVRSQCLLCHPCVGYAMFRDTVISHIATRHGVDKDAIQRGVHYKSVMLYELRRGLQMVEEEGVVTFKDPGRSLY